MIEVRTLRLLDIAPTRPGEPAFVAAASGLCELDGSLFVVADTEHTLAVFPVQTAGPGVRHLLVLPGALEHAPLPKPLKPDLEALCVLPGGQLLALPSGSTSVRRTGAVISVQRGQPVASPRLLDLAPLFERLTREVGPLNLEGAAVIGDSLWLAQRGNTASPSALLEVDLRALAGTDVPAAAFRRAVPLALGDVEGVPFTPTDLCPLPDGRLLICAVCEDTADSYRDGACVGAAIALVTPGQLRAERVERLEPTWKVEGLIARPGGSGLLLWMVCDADDPAQPSPLLEGRLA